MHNTIRAEMARHGLTLQSMAQELGMVNTTLSDKIKRKREFRLDEAGKIYTILKNKGSDVGFAELFDLEV